MEKKINNRISLLAIIQLGVLVGCTVLTNPATTAEDVFVDGTKGKESSDYYWYQGEKILLTANKEYVSLLLPSNFCLSDPGIGTLFPDLEISADIHSQDGLLIKARFKKKINSLTEYYAKLNVIMDNEYVLGVYPFFERGNGAPPIGTSDVFYVKLKAPGQAELPIEVQEFDTKLLLTLTQNTGVTIIKEVPYMSGWYVLSINGSIFNRSIDAANFFYESGYFAEVDPAFMFDFRSNATNDPLFSQQWGLKNMTNPGYDINVEGAWMFTTGTGTEIAIVDQGIDPSHNDLVGNLASWSFNAQIGTSPSMFIPTLYHGTHVAGIAAAVGNNNLQIAGVAYTSTIIRVGHNLQATPTASAELASGISWAWQTGADVINNSWGDHNGQYNSLHSSILENAIVNALTHGRSDLGTVVVFAAGNFGMNGAVMDYPATFDDRLLTVGSIGMAGYRSYFSGYGSKLDVVAPGEDILSTLPGNTVGTLSGTSMAAPHVSGIASLIISENPQLTRAEVVRIIQHTAKKISPGGLYTFNPKDYMFAEETWNQEVGYGLVDATAAVVMAHLLETPPTQSGTGMSMVLPSGPTIQQHYAIISGGNFPQTIYASLLPAQVNPAYTYYWYCPLAPGMDSKSDICLWKPGSHLYSIANFKQLYNVYTMLHL